MLFFWFLPHLLDVGCKSRLVGISFLNSMHKHHDQLLILSLSAMAIQSATHLHVIFWCLHPSFLDLANDNIPWSSLHRHQSQASILSGLGCNHWNRSLSSCGFLIFSYALKVWFWNIKRLDVVSHKLCNLWGVWRHVALNQVVHIRLSKFYPKIWSFKLP